MGLTYEVAKFVVEKGFDDFSGKEIQAVKDLVLDGVGTMISGIPEPVTQIMIQYAEDSGGRPDCGVVGAKFKTSLTQAAFLNGTSTHAVELESVGPYTGSNPMTNIPVALSAAEKFNLSGKAVIEGIIIGLEVQTKLGMSGPGAWDKGFSSIPLYGTLGAAASAGKMLKLSTEQMQHSFGIAIAQCSGQKRQQGSMGHLLENGIACRNGVTASILAKRGMTSDPNLLEGPRGLFDLFSTAGRGYDLENTVKSLGNPFCVAGGLYIKKYASCLYAHRAMDAIIQLKREHDIRYEDVQGVQVEVPTFVAEMLHFSEPRNGAETSFSMHQSLGSVLVDEVVELPYLRPFRDSGATDPKYIEARRKVEMIERADWSGGRSLPWSTPLTIVMKSGKKYTKTIDGNQLKGSPSNPLTHKELVARHGVLVRDFLSAKQTERSVDLIYNLENLDSVAELMKLLTYSEPK